MRYSRIKEQPAPSREHLHNRMSGFIFLIITAAAVIYIFSATKAGDFLSEKVVAPAVEFFTQKNADTSSEEVDVFSNQQSLITEELNLPAISQYFLQTGVFNTKDNAESAASELRSIGGAGYIREDNGQYRVIISGYSSKEDAINE